MKSTHGYAWYGRACTAPCTYNVVCMCGKIHAQESDKNNNNRSNKRIRLGRYEWGRNVCQEACRETVGRATCMCVCMCTTHIGKRNSRVIVAAGAARRGVGVSQPTSSRDFARPSLRIKLGDSGGDNGSKGDSNDDRKGTGSDADSSDVAWGVSELTSSLASGITILIFIFQHHTAWLPVSLGINEPKSAEHPPVWGRSEYAFFFLDMFDELSDFGFCGSSVFSFCAQSNCLAWLVEHSGEGQINKDDLNRYCTECEQL